MGARQTLRPEPEQALLDRLLVALRAAGWKVMHISDSRMVVNVGGRFCLAADPHCAGWPDIFCVHLATGRLAAIECKRRGRRPRANQVDWLDTLGGAGVATFVATRANEKAVLAELAELVAIVPEAVPAAA
jgi:hypothetical protein